MSFANGDVYEGEWSTNKREGTGKIRFRGGGMFSGQFFNNVFVSEIVIR
jgi:hypothetical protein